VNESSNAPVIERRLVLRDRFADVSRAQTELEAAAKEKRFDRTSIFAIKLALEEALSNAFKHGNRNDPEKDVSVSFQVNANTIKIEVEDQGEGFDLTAVPDPTAQENLEIPCGRGITLMRAYMSEVSFLPPGNKVRLVYTRPTARKQNKAAAGM
jgi:serine/threonine-protein kinase RsbW